MKFRYLGETGLLVSRLCLGSMTFGNREWGCTEKESIQLMYRFVEAGGNIIDTADRYNDGESENIIGKAVRELGRERMVLATKCFLPTSDAPTARGLSRKHIMEACEASLSRLRTDYIDLYQIHGPDTRTSPGETMRALDDLVRQGKVRYLGCSNLFAWQLVKANGISDRLGLDRFVCGQYLYNLVVRDVEREILPACFDQGMGFLCWSPLAGGMLTGNYRPADRPPEGSRMSKTGSSELPLFWHERGFTAAEAVVCQAKRTGMPAAAVALSWVLHDRRISAVITGSRTPAQLQGNLQAGEWDLPDEAWDCLDRAAPFDHGYPGTWMDIVYPDVYGKEEF
jgi:aryl-alcohol dehydrogenase-like predicted oxidoreductase